MYQSLYRKYRPDTFAKVIGQDHITTTLVNQIRTGNIAHAYLLTGTRGTGKTSVARIFARAINCLSPRDGSPCGECEVCRKLAAGTGLDIVEIDAASNNSVDDARSIRDSVRYAPIDCKYKVYIIDEVHQLSTAAFNALLKTLEEPPAHAVFILATTEVQKIPATILSRCLRLDFHLVPQNTLEAHVKNIFDQEGVHYTDEGVSAIAAAGEGSVRDTLSVADMCVSYSDVVDYNCVLGVLGANDPAVIAEIALYTLSGNVKSAIEKVENASALGKSIPLLTKDLTRYFRDLNIIKHDSDANLILKLPDKLFSVAAEIAADNKDVVLMRALDVFSEVEAKERYSTQPKILLETAIIKTATLTGEDLTDVLARIAKLETTVSEYESNPPRADYSGILKKLGASEKTATPAEQKVPTPMNQPQIVSKENEVAATMPVTDEPKVVATTENEPVQISQPQLSATAQEPPSIQSELMGEVTDVADLPFEAEPEVEPVKAPEAEDVVPAHSVDPAPQSVDVSNQKLTLTDIKSKIPSDVAGELKRLRGRILVELRNRKLLMVYIALFEESTLIHIQEGAITLAFAREDEYNYCNNATAIKALKEIFREELNADFDLKLVTYGNEESTSHSITNAELMELFAGADSIRFKSIYGGKK